MRRDEINVDYILQLLAKYVDTSDDERSKLRKQVEDLMGGDEKLRSKRKLIERFINGYLPKIKDSDQVDGEFQKYWSDEERKAIEKFAGEENLDVTRLERLISNYSYSGRKPRQDDYAKAFSDGYKLGIRERSSTLERIADKFAKFIIFLLMMYSIILCINYLRCICSTSDRSNT